MTLNAKLKTGILAAGLAATVLTACSGQGERILERERQSGLQVEVLANNYCNAPSRLPDQNLWYYEVIVEREANENNQERFSVIALQYDGRDYSCTGPWQDIGYSPQTP